MTDHDVLQSCAAALATFKTWAGDEGREAVGNQFIYLVDFNIFFMI